jgi:hypothetical protein
MFNQKLAWHTFTAQMFRMTGLSYAAGLPGSTHVIAQKSVVADWTLAGLLAPGILTAHTRWFPFMTADGQRLVVGVTAANQGELLTRVIAGAAYSAADAWLIRGASAEPVAFIDGGGDNTVDFIPDDSDDSLNESASTPSAALASPEAVQEPTE